MMKRILIMLKSLLRNTSFMPHNARRATIVRTFGMRKKLIFIISLHIVFHTSEYMANETLRSERKKETAIIFQYFMSYHLHISRHVSKCISDFCIFRCYVELRRQEVFPCNSLSRRKIKIFHSINHIRTSRKANIFCSISR